MPSTDAGSRMSSGSSGPDRSVLPGTSKRAMTSPLAHLPYVLARPPHAARSKLSSPGVFLTLAAPPVADLPTPPRQGLAVHSCCPTHISVSSLVGISRSSPSHLRSVPAAETLLTSQIYRPAPEDRHGPPPSDRKYHIHNPLAGSEGGRTSLGASPSPASRWPKRDGNWLLSLASLYMCTAMCTECIACEGNGAPICRGGWN